MRQFSPEMAQKVAHILHRRWKTWAMGRRSYSGFKAVADLLNRLNADESKKILETIEEGEPELHWNTEFDVHIRRSCDSAGGDDPRDRERRG